MVGLEAVAALTAAVALAELGQERGIRAAAPQVREQRLERLEDLDGPAQQRCPCEQHHSTGTLAQRDAGLGQLGAAALDPVRLVENHHLWCQPGAPRAGEWLLGRSTSKRVLWAGTCLFSSAWTSGLATMS